MIDITEDPEPIEPTPIRLRNCHASGWKYVGDGLFVRGFDIGCFTEWGWMTL